MENSGRSILGNRKIATDPIKVKQRNIIKHSKNHQEPCKFAEDPLKEAALNVSK
jgi:hypothetical protein